MEGESYPLSHLGTWQLIVCLFFSWIRRNLNIGIIFIWSFLCGSRIKDKIFCLGVKIKEIRYRSLVVNVGELVLSKLATCCSILAWEIPWTEEPGRLQSMGSQSWTRLSDFNQSNPNLPHRNTRGVLFLFLFFKDSQAPPLGVWFMTLCF